MNTTRVYKERGWVAHLLPELSSPNSWETALCGVEPGWNMWYGTGSQTEIDKVTILPTCRNCERKRKEIAMRYVADTEVYKYEETQVTLNAQPDLVINGQGRFQIVATSMVVVWVQMNGDKWTLSESKVRGPRTDNSLTGLCVWREIDDPTMPGWVKEITMEVKPK